MMSRLQSVRCCHLEGQPKMNRPWTAARLLTALAVALAPLVPAAAQENDVASLAQAAQNPIANMISVPFQLNMNYDTGPLGVRPSKCAQRGNHR
jgi:hypothetical protein